MQQNVIRYKVFYDQMQLLLITNNATNTSRDENHTNRQTLYPVYCEYDIGWVNRMEHDIAILYDTNLVRLQISQSHLNKGVIQIAYRTLAYYFLVYGNVRSINTSMTTASVNSNSANITFHIVKLVSKSRTHDRSVAHKTTTTY